MSSPTNQKFYLQSNSFHSFVQNRGGFLKFKDFSNLNDVKLHMYNDSYIK